MADSLKFLAIKNYRKHQHYHKRGAPWIKLYAAALTDAAFIQLPEAAQAQLMKLWILASQFGHPLPNNPKLLAGKIGTTGKFHLSALLDAGFLIPCNEDALAEPAKNASNLLDESVKVPLTEVEIELEIEPSISQSTVDESSLAADLTSDADRNALTAVVAKSRSRSACIAALRSMLSGNDPATPQPTAAHFGQALRDFAGNAESWNAAHFRGYLKRAAAPPADPTHQHTQKPRGGVAMRTFANGRDALRDIA